MRSESRWPVVSVILDRAARWHPAVIIAGTVAATLVVNLVLWMAGLAAGGSFEHTEAGMTKASAPGGVVIMTVIPLALGLTLAMFLAIKWIRIIAIAQVAGAAAALLTIGLTIAADFDTVSTLLLSLMHVVIALAVVTGLAAFARHPIVHRGQTDGERT